MGLHAQVLPNLDVDHLDALLLDADGRPQVVPAEVYAGIPWAELRVWCHLRAIYGLPTTELVDFLQGLVGGRSAIEVGSGNGALGRALGIPLTDSLMQLRPDVAFLYALQGQPRIRYGADVRKMEALSAIRQYRPKVVVGSWLTQYMDPSREGSREGSMYGIDEETLLDQVETYIMFGSIRNHGSKAICQREHQVIQEPWMWSRAQDSALFVWGPTGA